MQLEEKKELGLNFASNIEDIQKLIIDTMHGIKGQQSTSVKDTIQKEVFFEFVKKLFRYTDEIYYVEKRRKAQSEEKLQPKLLDVEIKRIQAKTKDLARAYSTQIYASIEVSRKKNYWEGILLFQTNLVRIAYKNDDEDIIKDLVEEANRQLRTNAFNCTLRDRIYDEQQEAFKDNVKQGCLKREKLDGMIAMLEYRKKINTGINGQMAKYYKRTDYRPLIIRQTPLKSVNTNSTQLSTLQPVVKDKKVVQYRIQNRARKFTRIGVDRDRVASMMDNDLKKQKEQNDISCDF